MNNTDNKEITLTLNANEVNGILQALGDKPFVQVVQLINKIHEQAQKQLSSNQTE